MTDAEREMASSIFLTSPSVKLALRIGATPFVQSSALAIVLLGARVFWSRDLDYTFLAWNLFLAWVPWVWAALLREVHDRAISLKESGDAKAPLWRIAPFFLLWLAFLPNAPYLVTDFIHLRYRDGTSAPLWYDAIMLAAFAWAGVGLGVASLRICSEVVRARSRGPWTATAFVATSGFLTGFGIYLGRFVRLNTWDVITRPLIVLDKVVEPLVHPLSHPRAWVVTFTFALFFLAAYGTGRARSRDQDAT